MSKPLTLICAPVFCHKIKIIISRELLLKYSFLVKLKLSKKHHPANLPPEFPLFSVLFAQSHSQPDFVVLASGFLSH